jgi:hypothetical protein
VRSSFEHDGEVLARVALLVAGAVEHVHEHPGALDVPQELVPEPAPVAGALDEARDVGDDEVDVVVADDPEVRGEGREGVVGDLGPGGRQARHQRGLAGVREPDQRDVGGKLELEREPALLPGLAELVEAWAAPPRGAERGVATSAAAARRRGDSARVRRGRRASCRRRRP